MGDMSRIIRKFERFMEHSHEELMEIGRKPRRVISDPPGKLIGHFTYNFENKTEKFTPTLEYRIRTFFNNIYSKVYSYFKGK
jgi:hypothetical protein